MTELAFWKARSTWLAIASLIASLVELLAGNVELAADIRSALPEHALTIIGAGGALWAYVERLRGKKKIVLAEGAP